MILVRLMGGLGNQMFQYAFGKMLSEKNGCELVLDDTLLKDRSFPNEIATHRNYDLDIFSIKGCRRATGEEVIRFNGVPANDLFGRLTYWFRRKTGKIHLLIQDQNRFYEKYLNASDETCVVGRWQSEKFFEGINGLIKKEFNLDHIITPEIKQFAEKIKKEESVGIHVRRGDLVSSTLYSKTIGTLDLDYYQRAAELIKEKSGCSKGYIFSDDPAWCRENLTFPFPHEVIGNEYAGRKGSGHLYLLSSCKHQIISNSTFSWWGAWLNTWEKKCVIGPLNWYKDKSLCHDHIYPKNWIAL